MSAIQFGSGHPTICRLPPFHLKEPFKLPYTARPLSVEFNRVVEENARTLETKHPQLLKKTYIESNALTKDAAESVLAGLRGYYEGKVEACRTVRNMGKYRVRLVIEPLPLQVKNNANLFLHLFHQLITLKKIHNQDDWKDKIDQFPQEQRAVKEIIDHIFKPLRCSIITHEPNLGEYDPETDSYSLALKKIRRLSTYDSDQSEKGSISYIKKIPKALIREWAEFYNVGEEPKFERAMSFRIPASPGMDVLNTLTYQTGIGIPRSPEMNVLKTLSNQTALRLRIGHPPALDMAVMRFPSSSSLSPLSPPPLLRQNAIYHESGSLGLE